MVKIAATRARIRRYQRLQQGLCTTCGHHKPQIGVTCDFCIKKKSIYYHQRITQQICLCGVILINGRRCRNCLDNEQKRHYKLVLEIIDHYGNKCVCCQKNDPAILTLDHINGGGNIHTRKVGRGSNIYRWIKRNNFPIGFQILCANCNHGKARNNGICPHIIKQPKNTVHARYLRKANEQAIVKYGGFCVYCGEMERLFLVIDHIKNDGAEHRRQIGHKLLVAWLRQNNYPNGFQTLCDNCNLKKTRSFLINNK